MVDETREKAGHICFRKCTIEDLAELRALSSRAFFETFAAQNKPEDMEAYLKDAFSEEKMRAELLESGSTFYFLLVDSELAGYLKLNECGAQTDIHSPDSLEIERIYLDKLPGQGTWQLPHGHGCGSCQAKGYALPLAWRVGEEHKGPRLLPKEQLSQDKRTLLCHRQQQADRLHHAQGVGIVHSFALNRDRKKWT